MGSSFSDEIGSPGRGAMCNRRAIFAILLAVVWSNELSESFKPTELADAENLLETTPKASEGQCEKEKMALKAKVISLEKRLKAAQGVKPVAKALLPKLVADMDMGKKLSAREAAATSNTLKKSLKDAA